MSQSAAELGRSFQGEAGAADFQNWLARFPGEPHTTFYAQHPFKPGESGVCIAVVLPENFTLSDWEQGRIFNDEFELRWHAQGDTVNLLLLTEQKKVPTVCVGLCAWQGTNGTYEVASTWHMLVGTFYRREDDWFFAEAGVPRAFRYPVDIKSLTQRAHVVLHGKHYLRGGSTTLTRFTHLAPERRQGGERQ